MKCDFVEVIIQMVTTIFKIINLKKRFIIWKIKEDKVGTSIIIIILKVGETTTIISLILGENKQIGGYLAGICASITVQPKEY